MRFGILALLFLVLAMLVGCGEPDSADDSARALDLTTVPTTPPATVTNTAIPSVPSSDRISPTVRNKTSVTRTAIATLETPPAQCFVTPAPREPATYQGTVLPTPEPVTGPDPPARLPSAWLIKDSGATLATFGNYYYRYDDLGPGCPSAVHADMMPPQMNPDLAVATVSTEQQIVIAMAGPSITVTQVTMQDWHEDITPIFGPDTHELTFETTREDELIMVTLEPLTEPGDQLLVISTSFERGSLMYLWRLKPSV